MGAFDGFGLFGGPVWPSRSGGCSRGKNRVFTRQLWARRDLPNLITCKYCGVTRLIWQKWRGDWRLIDEDGQAHRCKTDPDKVLALFEELE